MRLTKNEKQTLRMLLDNSRMSDIEIANKLKISSQAVGKIRRKLENSVIENYSLSLDYAKLGIKTFALGIAALKKEGLDLGHLEVEHKLLNNPHIINVYRIPKGSSTHIIMFGFQEITELDNFFHSPDMMKEIHNYIEIQDLYTFSHNSLIKDNPNQLFHKVLQNMDSASAQLKFRELENFKKRL